MDGTGNSFFFFSFSTDYFTVQRPAPPPAFLALNSEDIRNTRLIRSVAIPEEGQSSHSSSTPPHLPSTAINAESQMKVSSKVVAESPGKTIKELNKSSTPSKNALPSTMNPAEKAYPSQCSQGTQTTRGPHQFMEHTPSRREDQATQIEKKHFSQEVKSNHTAEPSTAAKMSTGSPSVHAALITPARREPFHNFSSHTLVRRTKSEGHVRVAVASAGQAQSAVPEICTDATMNDRLWSKLEPGSHRNSVSSSSSISSSDTVIDLSLPNLARKSLTSQSKASNKSDPPWVNCRHSVLVSYDPQKVSKSKSNPNLQESTDANDELKPRPLQQLQEGSMDSPGRLAQRRHTWSRLYMEGLKQSSAKRPSLAATPPTAAASLSKSLGDLTSDDITCNFESKYRSISRSFIVRPAREQLRKGSPQKCRPASDLTEQLRKLTDVEPLTASDFTHANEPREPQEEPVDESLVRRTSSRSQSRVRYIANRAKKAQERQRLQGLAQGRSASFSLTSFGSGSGASPIEERGNPEGACCVSRSPCTNLDLLSQLTPLGSPASRQFQSSPDSENSEVFFRLKL